MGRRPKQTVLIRHTNGQEGHEKMFNIVNYQRIKTTMRYHLTSVRMAFIKKSTINQYWKGCGERGTLQNCSCECKLAQPLWKIVWRFLKKLEIELPYDPAVLLLGIYLEKNRIRKDTCTPVFLVALFTIAKTWKQPKCSLTEEWIKKI